ncbi:MAG TPA: hypothetical protein PKW50_10000 [Syntrophomonas sp.]|nr:hypothetical protein [Syntrophomonas sp.]
MNERNTNANRLWWMAVVGALLFAAAGAVPVAALEWPSNNNTFIIPANGMRTHGDNFGSSANFSYNGNASYYFMMLNGTQGMNAIHITNQTTDSDGGIYENQPASGTFYVSSTGGHTGDDNVLLLIAVAGDDTDVSDFRINLAVSGYNWAPLAGATAPTWTNITHYNYTYYNTSTLNREFDAADYLQISGGDAIQDWKFAPLNDYPVYGGQDMENEDEFHLILVDLNVGAISSTFGHSTDLDNGGMAKVQYTITSDLSQNAKVAFNAYVFNRDAPQAKGTVHWLNRLYADGESSTGSSGFSV